MQVAVIRNAPGRLALLGVLLLALLLTSCGGGSSVSTPPGSDIVVSELQSDSFGQRTVIDADRLLDGRKSVQALAPYAREGTAEFAPGEVLVGLRPGVAVSAITAARRGLGATSVKAFPRINVELWRLPPAVTVETAVRALSRNPNVEYAEPNYIYHTATFPDDPYFYQLWGMHNTGNSPFGGTADADIDAPEAWDVETGSSEIVVAVIDTGIDYTHEDLSGNMWTNPGEIPGNGVDDDGNGYVDDYYGYDFAYDDSDPWDGDGHGTHVSGTIGAVGNNATGVVGVNWDVKLMACKFLDDTGSGYTSDAIDAINYAKSFGVRITNNSWGGGGRSWSLGRAIRDSGALFVAAAGNSGSSRRFYPAAYGYGNIISVAATDSSDKLASWSNYSSSWVDLGAPGVDITSTVPFDIYGFKYGYTSGTSMATPHVSGAAALVMAHFTGYSNSQAKSAIMDGVDSLDSLSGKTVTGGRLNAARALGIEPDAPPNAPPVAHLSADPTSGYAPLTVDFDASASYDPDGGSIAKFEWDWEGDGTYDYDSGTDPSVSYTYSDPGTYDATVRATDDEGDTDTASVTITVNEGAGEPTTIAYDGFESGNFSGGFGWLAAWSVSGDARIYTRNGPFGSYHVRLRRNTGYITRTLDLSGASDVHFTFWAKVRSFEKSDKAYVLVSPDGVNFTVVKTFTSGDSDSKYHSYDIDISGFDMTGTFHVAFDAQMSSRGDYWYIDEIEITGVV